MESWYYWFQTQPQQKVLHEWYARDKETFQKILVDLNYFNDLKDNLATSEKINAFCILLEIYGMRCVKDWQYSGIKR